MGVEATPGAVEAHARTDASAASALTVFCTEAKAVASLETVNAIRSAKVAANAVMRAVAMAHAASRSPGGIRMRATSRATKPTRSATGTNRMTSAQAGWALSHETKSHNSRLPTNCQPAISLRPRSAGGGELSDLHRRVCRVELAPGFMVGERLPLGDDDRLRRHFPAYHRMNPAVSIKYSAVGSTAGISTFSANQVAFGASDVPMTAAEQMSAQGGPSVQVPVDLGAEVLTTTCQVRRLVFI